MRALENRGQRAFVGWLRGYASEVVFWRQIDLCGSWWVAVVSPLVRVGARLLRVGAGGWACVGAGALLPFAVAVCRLPLPEAGEDTPLAAHTGHAHHWPRFPLATTGHHWPPAVTGPLD